METSDLRQEGGNERVEVGLSLQCILKVEQMVLFSGTFDVGYKRKATGKMGLSFSETRKIASKAGWNKNQEFWIGRVQGA